MTVSFSSAKAILVAEASALATEATDAGLTSLSTALTNLASEISGSSPDYYEFFGGTNNTYDPVTSALISSTSYNGVATVWAQAISAAAQTIADHNQKTIVDKQTTIADKQTIIADQITTATTQLITITAQQTTIAAKQTAMETYQKRMKELAESTGTGIHVIGPWEWLGYASLIKLYQEQNVDFAQLKSIVDNLPKSI